MTVSTAYCYALYLFEINHVLMVRCCLSARPRLGTGKSIECGWCILPTIKPVNTTIDVDHDTQPGTIRDENWCGDTVRTVMEAFLVLELRSRRP